MTAPRPRAPQHRRRLASAASALALAAAFTVAIGAPAPAAAQAAAQPVAVAAGPLDAAILELAQKTGISVYVPADLVAGKTAPPVSGTLTPEDALRKLLAGSGLTFRRNADGSFVVVQAPIKAVTRATQLAHEAPPVRPVPEAAVIEEVIVTAEKREETLQNIPIAISAFSGQTLEDAGVKGISDLRQLAPSLQFGQTAGADNFVSVRGVGAELQDVGAEPGVTISQDGVPFSNQYLFDADFFDIERVELLRGPQGTISGRNATGGAINIHSKRPTADPEGSLKVTLGNYDRLGTEGHLSGPILAQRLFGRIAVRTERADGWLKNVFRDEEQNDADKVQARASLLGSLTDSLEAHLILEGMIDRASRVPVLDVGRARADKPGLAETLGVPGFNWDRLEYQADYPNTRRVESYKSILKLTWELGPSARLASTTGYLRYDHRRGGDFDGTIVEVVNFQNQDVHLWQASQELTFTADLTDRLDVIAGALFLRASASQVLVLGLPLLGLPDRFVEANVDQDLRSYAAYAQWRYRLAETLRVSLGARYTHDEKDYVGDTLLFGGMLPVIRKSGDWQAFTPRFAVDFAPTDDLTFFGSISRGFKAGGFNTFGSVDEFDPEFVWSYEVGAKAYFLDRRLRTAVTGFHMDYKNLQQNLLIVDPATLITSPVVENAAAATIAGVELELQARVSDELSLAATGTWLDATFDELRSGDNIFPELGERDLAGNRLVRAPEFQFTVSGEYRAPVANGLEAVLRADYVWQDRIFFSFFNHPLNSQEAYGLLNLSGALETDDGRWRLTVFARNALNERYGSHSFALPGATPTPTFARTANVGEPRMYGVSLEHRF